MVKDLVYLFHFREIFFCLFLLFGLQKNWHNFCRTSRLLTENVLIINSSLQLYAEKVATRGLCAIAQCESLRYKLIGGLAVRR